MDEKKQAIISKVEKILIQAKDQEGTPEGKAFKLAAAKLMAKYRIEESEIDMEQGNLIRDQFSFLADEGNIPQWVENIMSVFGNTFDVKTIYRNYTWENPIRREWDYIGTFSDVETAMYFASVCVNHIDKAGWKEFPATKNWQKRNQLGNVAARIIISRAYDLKKDMNVTMHADKACRDLVVCKMDMINEAVDKEYPNLKFGRSKKMDLPLDSKTIEAGKAAGESAPMNFGIEAA